MITTNDWETQTQVDMFDHYLETTADYEDRTKVKAEIAQARKVLTNLKKKSDKRKKKTITGHKGEKKDQE